MLFSLLPTFNVGVPHMFNTLKLRKSDRRKKKAAGSNIRFREGLHLGCGGMVYIRKREDHYSVKGWVLNPLTKKQMRVDARAFTKDEAAGFLKLTKGKSALPGHIHQACVSLRQVRNEQRQYHVKPFSNKFNRCYLVSKGGVPVGTLELAEKNEYGESWAIYDMTGTQIGNGLSRRHALNMLTAYAINFQVQVG